MKIYTNFKCIQELITKVKDETIRYKIIFLDTLLGSYYARKVNPKIFIPQKHTSTGIYEAKAIADARKRTLEKLDKQSPEKVFKELRENILRFTKLVEKTGLYEKLEKLKDEAEIAGKNLEKKIIEKGENIEITDKKFEDYLKSKLFDKEASIMSEALFDAKEEIKN